MSAKSFIVINFPVSPHVYKYLQKKVGEKLEVSRADFLGSLVLDILSKRYYQNHIVNSDLTFPVEIGLRYMADYGIYLNASVSKKFDRQIDNMFREEMITHLEISIKTHGSQRTDALSNFLHYYNISEEDIKFETLLKYFDREVKDRKKIT